MRSQSLLFLHQAGSWASTNPFTDFCFIFCLAIKSCPSPKSSSMAPNLRWPLSRTAFGRGDIKYDVTLNLYPPWSELIRYNFMEKGQSFYIDSPDSLSLNILILISTKWTNHQRLYKKKQLPFLGQLKLEIYLSSTSSNRLLLFSVLRKLEKHHLAIFLPTLLLRLKYWTAK